MQIAITTVGIIFVLAGIVYMVKPNVAKSILEFFNKGRRLYFIAMTRLGLAVVFLLGAGDCNKPWVIITFGIILMASGVMIFAMKLEKIKSILQWWQNQPAILVRAMALIALAIGAVVIYSA